MNVLEKLDVYHRKHLQTILNYNWPDGIISNETLYKRCDSIKLSFRVAESRWKMLGHVLRSSENSPAQNALSFAVNAMKQMRGRVGRHRMNLLSIIKSDLQARDLSLSSYDDILELRELAQDRPRWKQMFQLETY